MSNFNVTSAPKDVKRDIKNVCFLNKWICACLEHTRVHKA